MPCVGTLRGALVAYVSKQRMPFTGIRCFFSFIFHWLFDIVSPDDLFARVIDKYFAGKPDPRTMEILAAKRG